ncbi:MAG TPA: response regulator [Candidatus Binatia bacterium]|nr:response regulator [Candidatus Binatia bacterium]
MSADAIRLLLVEDDPADVLALEHCLSEIEGLDFKLNHREGLEGALDFLCQRPCDLVLLDLGLPDSQGMETLTRLHGDMPDVPVVVLTGLDDEALGLKALQSGAQDYLVKGQTQAAVLGKAIQYAIERNRMKRAALRGEKLQALGTLAAGIAHDFNNILLAVSGNAKLALEQLAADHPAYENVLEIAKAGSRAVALTRKILSFSQQQETTLHPTRLEALVEEAVSLIRPMLPVRVALTRYFPPGLPPVMADAAQVHQVIISLATNAAEAIGEHPGLVEISAAPIHLNGNGSTLSARLAHGDYVKLSFKDSGRGIDRAIEPHIFEPFFTTKAQGRGTGMGLAIVHGIMKTHRGEVTFYSEPGKGTVFNLYFPAAMEGPTELPVPGTVPAGHGQHILYVDDEEPLVLLIPRALRRLGYRVTGYTNPLEALHAMRQDACGFQAVVTDLSMPQMSGTDFAQEVLKLCPRMPVILTTGYIRPQDEELANRIGIRELILKPDTAEELGRALHRALEADGQHLGGASNKASAEP